MIPVPHLGGGLGSPQTLDDSRRVVEVIPPLMKLVWAGEDVYVLSGQPSEPSSLWQAGRLRSRPLPDLKIQELLDVEIASDGKSLLARRKDGGAELWNLSLGQRLQRWGDASVVVAWFCDRWACFQLSGGALAILDPASGQTIAELPEVGWGQSVVLKEPECEVFDVWTMDGRVLRFEKARSFFHWVVPVGGCRNTALPGTGSSGSAPVSVSAPSSTR